MTARRPRTRRTSSTCRRSTPTWSPSTRRSTTWRAFRHATSRRSRLSRDRVGPRSVSEPVGLGIRGAGGLSTSLSRPVWHHLRVGTAGRGAISGPAGGTPMSGSIRTRSCGSASSGGRFGTPFYPRRCSPGPTAARSRCRVRHHAHCLVSGRGVPVLRAAAASRQGCFRPSWSLLERAAGVVTLLAAREAEPLPALPPLTPVQEVLPPARSLDGPAQVAREPVVTAPGPQRP